jgi:hypothetical protein
LFEFASDSNVTKQQGAQFVQLVLQFRPRRKPRQIREIARFQMLMIATMVLGMILGFTVGTHQGRLATDGTDTPWSKHIVRCRTIRARANHILLFRQRRCCSATTTIKDKIRSLPETVFRGSKFVQVLVNASL